LVNAARYYQDAQCEVYVTLAKMWLKQTLNNITAKTISFNEIRKGRKKINQNKYG